MTFKIYENEEVIGYLEFEKTYKIELPNDYYWLLAFLEILLNEPIYYKEQVLKPYSYQHLLACIEQFEAMKNSELNWDIFIQIVGGDIRNFKISP